MDIDLQRIFQALPFSCLILHVDAGFTIAEASDAYLRATGTRRSDLLGRAIFDIFPDNPQERQSQHSDLVRQSFLAVMRTGSAQAMRLQRYDVPSNAGGFLPKYWLTTNHPVFDDAGRVAWIVHRVQDVTQLSQAAGSAASAAAAEPGAMRL